MNNCDTSDKFDSYGLDLEKTIFVVDSPTTAFMISILAEGETINVVLEKKKDLETNNASELLLNFVNACISIKNIRIVEVPHRFYISSKELRKIWSIRRETKKLYKEYADDTVFVGAPTSTFIRSLRCDSHKIIFLYHGLTDLFKREESSISKKGMKWLLQRIIIGDLIGLPHSIWCNFWTEKAFSLCKLNSKDEVWLNLYNFESKQIEDKLKFFDRYIDDKKNVLFFPVTSGHVKDGVDADATSFDQFNYDFLLKHIDSKTERVFLKYHPWLYRANDSIRNDLTEVLNQKGIEAYDIAAMIPDEIGGALLPTEVICKYMSIQKMISMDTSTMWYLSGNKSIEKIIDLRNAPEEYRKIMINCIERLKEKSDVDDILFYI